jgi:hypothetical protein
MWREIEKWNEVKRWEEKWTEYIKNCPYVVLNTKECKVEMMEQNTMPNRLQNYGSW